jgi:hypothetical protein
LHDEGSEEAPVAGTAVSTRTGTREDRIREILEDLVHQRQSIRSSLVPDETGLLEANRRSIVYWQAELSRALVEKRNRHEAAA